MNQPQRATYLSRKLRKNITPAEKALWNLLRNRQINGIKFRRQVPIGKYIADFVSIEKKLIIEVDGGQHNEENAILFDKIRTKYLEKQGYTVLRFWNNDVLLNKSEVINAIMRILPSS